MTEYCPATGKLKHASQWKAAKAMRRLGNNGTAYHCPHCNGWHHAKANSRQLKWERIRREANK